MQHSGQTGRVIFSQLSYLVKQYFPTGWIKSIYNNNNNNSTQVLYSEADKLKKYSILTESMKIVI